MRNVSKVYNPKSSHWVGDGFLVYPLFTHMDEVDKGTNPFLMLDYAAPQYFEPNNEQPRGVGEHPHKGFETVTIAYAGEVEHRDSTGGGGVIKQGDVQWMTAGAGVTHQEFHSKEFSQKGGLFEMVQLWVNLPKAHKNTQPKYQHLPKERIPVVSIGDGEARIIAGEYENTRGAASTFTPLNVWDISLKEDDKITLDLPASHNLSLVILRGNVIINNSQKASETQLVRFENASSAVIIKAMGGEAKILLLSGEPIDEPVVGYGPFVMNTKEEINQAIDDYRRGEFGQIPVEN